jgi:hypothetical protein
MEIPSNIIQRAAYHTTFAVLKPRKSPVGNLPNRSVALAHQHTLPSFAHLRRYLSLRLPRNPQIPENSSCQFLPFIRLVSPSPKIVLPTNRTRNTYTMATSAPETTQKPLCGVEKSKRLAAYKAVEDHFDVNYKYIGIGSGSTVVYVVEAIAAKGRDVTSKMIFVPTYENPHTFSAIPFLPQYRT